MDDHKRDINREQTIPDGSRDIKQAAERLFLQVVIFSTVVNMAAAISGIYAYNKILKIVDVIDTEVEAIIEAGSEYHQTIEKLSQSTLDLNESVHQFVQTVSDYQLLKK